MVSIEMFAGTLVIIRRAAEDKGSKKMQNALKLYKAENITELNYLVEIGELSKEILELLGDY